MQRRHMRAITTSAWKLRRKRTICVHVNPEVTGKTDERLVHACMHGSVNVAIRCMTV